MVSEMFVSPKEQTTRSCLARPPGRTTVIALVPGFVSGAVVGVGLGAAAVCSEVSSGFVPLVLALLVVDLLGVVVVVMPAIRASPTAINLPPEC